MKEKSKEMCISGFHVYKDVWDAVVGEELECERERRNNYDRYAVAVKRNGDVVGHLPRKFSRICALFIKRGRLISCMVTGSRRYSADLQQGGLEIPCLVTFKGTRELIHKLDRLL